jgi:hypothetical protein
MSSYPEGQCNFFGGGKNFYSGYSKNKTVFYNTAELSPIQDFF